MILTTTRLYFEIYENIDEKNVLRKYIYNEAVDTAPLKKSMFFLTPKLFILFAVFIFSKEATTHKVLLNMNENKNKQFDLKKTFFNK